MKSISHRLAILTLCAAAAALVPAPGRARAQTASLAPATPPPAATDPFAAVDPFGAPQDPRFNIELEENVPAIEAVALASKRLGHPINIVWTTGSEATPLPALRLHQVTVNEFFAAVTAAGRIGLEQGRSGYQFTEIPEAPNVFTFSVSQLPEPGLQQLGRQRQLQSAVQLQPASPPPKPKQSQFFDVSGLLGEKLSIDDITTAIRTAWGAAATEGDEPPMEALKFHQETQLLIATGSPEQLEAVNNLLALLGSRPQIVGVELDRKLHIVESEQKKNTRTLDAHRAKLVEMRDMMLPLNTSVEEIVQTLQEQDARLKALEKDREKE